MAIKIIPHSAEYSAEVAQFNERMRAGGSKWGFYVDPVPDWIARTPSAKTWREYHLAVENEATVRGGYALKPQQWLVHGEEAWLTDWQGPFTEAAIDVKYSPLMLRLFRHMQKEHPLLFSLGHGGTEEPIVDLLRKMNWELWGIPFCFRVLKPFNFLRKNKYLRNKWWKRLALEVAAWTGLGWLAVKLLHGLIKLTNGGGGGDARAEVVDSFGSWTDELWDEAKSQYSCLAVRDSAMMNSLMPASGWPGGTRLRISEGETTIGWAVVHAKQLVDDDRFGRMNVGLITDCFAEVEHAAAVLAAADRYLRSQSVDMIFANLSHPAWVDGLKSAGYVVLPERRIFALAPALSTALAPADVARQGLHLTNMDGHGPHGFY